MGIVWDLTPGLICWPFYGPKKVKHCPTKTQKKSVFQQNQYKIWWKRHTAGWKWNWDCSEWPYNWFFSRKIVWFRMIWVSVLKIDLWGIFPAQFSSLRWDLWSIMTFIQNHRTNLVNNKVNFKMPYLLIYLNSDLKFVFCDKSWVRKIPRSSIFGTSTQIIPNQTSLREKNQ